MHVVKVVNMYIDKHIGLMCSMGMFCSASKLAIDVLCSMMQDFRGREPSTEALLRHNDLLPAAA